MKGEERGPLLFHIALALPPLSLFLTPIAAFVNRGALRKLCICLWVIDTLAFASIALLYDVTDGQSLRAIDAQAPAPSKKKRIGVGLSEDPQHAYPVRVDEVLYRYPAHRAGVMTGDRIASVDGTRVHKVQDTIDALQASQSANVLLQTPQGPRHVTLRPVSPTSVRAAGLFEANSDRCEAVQNPLRAHQWVLVFLFLLGCGGAWEYGRRKGKPGVRFWLPFIIGLGVAASMPLFGSHLGCIVLKGHTLGVMHLSVAMQFFSMMGLAFLLRRTAGPGTTLLTMGPVLAPLQAYARGLFYSAAWVPRLALVAFGSLAAVGRLVSQSSPLESMYDGSAASITLMVLNAVCLAPIAEELLFRQTLLPWLSRTMAASSAIAVTSLLFMLMHISHGPAMVGPGVLGIVLGWVRSRSGRIAPAVALHATFNLAAVLAYLWFA